MKKLNLFIASMLLCVLAGFGQFTVTTVPPLAGTNGNAGVAFGVRSTQTILIDTMYCSFTGTGTTEIWVTTTDLTGPPNITTANGWTNLGSATIATATTAGNVVAIPLNLAYTVLPNTDYRFYVNGAGSPGGAAMTYTTGTAGVGAPFTDGTVTIETGNLVGYGGAIPSPGFHPRQFNGSIKYTILGGANDAAVLSVDSPTVYCAGVQDVYATIANFGSNQIDSVDVDWSVNGVSQPQLRYIGLLDTLNGAGSQSAQVLLGNFNFPAGASNVQVYVSNPNGLVDTTNFNDTMNISVQSAAAPTSIALNNVTLNSVDVSAVGGAGTIDYEIGPIGFAPGTGVTGSSPVPNFTIGGLSQGTTYDVYVRSNCGSGDVSAYVGPQTFNTAYGVPYFQDFENWNPGILNNPLAEGWSKAGAGPRWEAEDATGANENSGNTGPFYDATTPTTVGGMYLYLETSTGGGADTLFSPPIFINPTLTTIEVGFSYHMFGAAMGNLDVYADTNGVRNLLVSYVGQQQANQPDPFARFSTFLNGYQGKSVQLVFVGTRGTSFTSDMAIDNVTIDPVLPLNAGVIEVQNPVGNLCAGPVTPVVGVKNFGSNIIDSVNVVWDINGALDSVMYVGTILPGDTAAVSLATLNISSTVVYDLEFYTNRPNNAADQFTADDTLKVPGLRTGLAGTLTLDASLPASASNFTTFSQLEQVLNNYGVCGSVTVNVAPGTYNESLYIDNAPGMSSVNTLTIDGGDSSTTTITHDNTTNYGTVSIVGTDYVTIRNMRIEATANNGAAILLNNASNNTFENNALWANPNSLSTNTNFTISGTTTSISTNGIGSYNTLQNNLMVGGYYSVYMYGAAAAGSSVGNVINNNQMDSVYYYGSYIFYQDSLQYTNNEVDQATRGQINGDGMFLYYSSNYDVSGNYFHAQDYGIYFYNFGTNAPPLNGSNLVSNNMVVSENDYGMYFLYDTEVDLFYNSVASYGSTNPAVQIQTTASKLIDNFDLRNNVFYSGTTEAFELTGIPDTIFSKMDNNVYYTGGANMFNINGAAYPDLAAYQTAQPALNASSLDGDPQFISTSDLHVIGAFIDGAGDNSVPIAVDIDGDTRPRPGSTVVDPGADEFDPPLCPPSVNLGVTNVTLTSADIFWDGVAMDYQYEILPAGAAQGSQGVGNYVRTGLDSVTVTGLTASTSYDFYTREICGRGDTSIWIGPFSFNTSNGLPYFEDFETFPSGIVGNPWPRGWSSTTSTDPNWETTRGLGRTNSSGGTGPWYDHTLGGVSGGTYVYMETSGGTVGATADLVSPPVFVDTSATAFTVSYWYFMYGSNIDSLEVFILSNGNYNKIASYVGQQQTAHLDPWLEGKHNLSGYAGQSVQVVFRGTNPPCCSGDIGIDDVNLFEPSPEDGAVTDILSPGSGCGLGSADSVRVEISNLGTSFLTNFPVVYTLNGGAAVVETYLDTIQPGNIANFTFNTTVNVATPGTYDIVSYTDVATDGDNTNDTNRVSINSIPIVGGFPYNEGFESGNGGWSVQGNSTFALGTPAGSVINSAANGTQSWVTNLTGNYNNGEEGWVESPCLDFSTLVNPVIEMSVWWESEFSWDGAVLQSSIDGGTTWQNVGALGDPDNWYTDNSINGLANINNQEGWTGRNGTGSPGWVTAKNTMSSLAGVGGVILRVAFGSDGSVQDEGFAFDDVVIREGSAYDMSVLEIVTPVSGAYLTGATDSVRVRLANLGSDTANNFTVNYVLNGGAVQTETIAQMLPNDTMMYTFNTPVLLPTTGQTDTLDVYVDFTLDSVYTNDSIMGYRYDNDLRTFPYTEDFEGGYVTGNVFTNQQGGWSSTRTGSPDWELEDATGANENSTGTGPFWDRTTFGTAGGFYAYLECSGGSLGDQDTMRSPSIVIPATVGPIALDYSYHMFGADMGTLEVFIEANGTYTRIDSVGGQIQLAGDSAWSDTSIALTGAFNGQIVNIVFVGTRGSDFDSDMSIDEIKLDILTGVGQVASELEGISITPNPSNGLFTMNIETLAKENFNVTVRDAQGREVYTENLNVNGTYRNDLDFTSFAKGVYYMQIQTETESTVEKLIIQ